jgi:hypothetical protein
MDEQAAFPPPPPTQPVPQAELQPEFHSVLVNVEAPPKPKRGRLFAALAAVVLLIGGFVAYLVLADDSSSEQYSLTAAVSGARGADSIAYEMRMDMGIIGEIIIDGRFDAENQRMAMTMTIDGMDAADMPEVEYLIDMESQMMYVNAEALADSGLDVDTPWIGVDLSESSVMNDLGAMGSNPADLAASFADAENVEDLGMETIDGVEVRHYRVTVGIDDVLAANPALEGQYEDAGAELPDEIVYEVYVDASNQMKRMTFDLDIMGQSITFEMTITALDDVEPIVIPDPSDVTEETIPGM